MAKLVQMGGEVIGFDADLADRGAHGPDAQTSVIQLLANLAGLFNGDVGDVLPIHAADLQALQAVALHGRDLTVDLTGGFISKGINIQCFHWSSSLITV